METYDEKAHGKVLWVCKRSSVYTTVLSLLYVAFFVLFFIYLYSKGKAVAVVCERKLLIPCSPFFEKQNILECIRAKYIALDYSEVAGVSEDWRFLYLGERSSGGIVEMPVSFRYVSGEDKNKLETWIDKQQRKD